MQWGDFMDMDTFQWSSAITVAPVVIYDSVKDDKFMQVLLSIFGGTTNSISSMATTTTVVTAIDSQVNASEIECNKSLNTYVESMSDEELEAAFMKFGLLDSDDNTNNLIK